MRPLQAAALVFGLAAACGPAEDSPAGDRPAEPPVAEAPEAPPAAPESSDPWAIHHDHAGPVRFGMTMAEAQAVAPGEWSGSSVASEECGHGRATAAPPSLSFMVVGGRVVRADVADEPGERVTTAAGVGVGATEAEVRAAYPGVTEMPHKYTDGHYLVVRAGPAADSATRIVFETDGTVVTRYRAGLTPQVEWVEGCL